MGKQIIMASVVLFNLKKHFKENFKNDLDDTLYIHKMDLRKEKQPYIFPNNV